MWDVTGPPHGPQRRPCAPEPRGTAVAGRSLPARVKPCGS